MKILATLGVLLLAAPPTLLAQNEGDRKVRIEVSRNENGNTTHVTREFDLSDEKQLVDALKELGVIDELNIIGSDENLVLDMRRMRQGGALNDMSIAMCIPNAEMEHEASAYLGVYYGDWDGGCEMDGKDKDKKDKKDKAPVKEGACITAVESGTPAETAGLRQGDVIVELGGMKVTGGESLVNAIGKHKPGDEVKIVYYRGKEKNDVTVALGEREEEEAPAVWDFNWSDDEGAWGGAGDWNWNSEPQPFLGVDGKDVDGEKGVEVTNVVEGSSAEKMGLKEKDVITKINDKKVMNFQVLAELIGEMEPGEEVELNVLRDGKTVTLHGELGEKEGPGFRFYTPAPPGAPGMYVIPEMPEMPDAPEMPELRGLDELMPYMHDNEALREAQQEYREAQRAYRDAQREYQQEYREIMRQEMDELRREMDRLRQDLRGDVTREMRVSISAVELTKEEAELLKNKGVTNLDKSLDVQELRCFPNPTNGSFHVSFTAPQRGDLNVDVHDATGERVYHETITGFKGRYERVLDLSDKTDGTYFVVISQGGASVARKMVKQ